MSIYIDSEVGQLKKVMIHSPGKEIEAMTPKSAEKVLYNDIIPLSVVEKEHKEVEAALRLIAQPFEILDLLSDVLQDEAQRLTLVDILVKAYKVEHRKADLQALPVSELITVIVSGLLERQDSLTAFLRDFEFDMPPIPNLYFTRDVGIIFRDFMSTGSMAHDVRRGETLLVDFVLKNHPEFKVEKVLFDGAHNLDTAVTMEGGDFHIFQKNILLIGMSERTSPQAIDEIARQIQAKIKEDMTIFAVTLPREKSTIHLDMIFSFVDKDKAVVYEPYVLGHDRLPVVRMDIKAKGKITMRRVNSLLDGLKEMGIDIHPILCGDGHPLFQEREQYLSATNFLSFAPGKALGYDCNEYTLRALEKAGFSIVAAKDLINGKYSIKDFDKMIIGINGTELARGGGGLRCMTMPLEREALSFV